MKIEIDYKEVEEIKERNKQLEESVRDLKAQLSEFNKETIEKTSITIAEKMFQAVMERVCLELNIKYEQILRSESFISLTRKLGKSWWNSDKLSIEPIMMISKSFKTFFIGFGEIHNEDDSFSEKEEDYDFEVKNKTKSK